MFDIVLQGSGLTGSIVSNLESVGFTGWRAAVHVELKP
jgi:hypothetical protein